jgi:hypothetical protein
VQLCRKHDKYSSESPTQKKSNYRHWVAYVFVGSENFFVPNLCNSIRWTRKTQINWSISFSSFYREFSEKSIFQKLNFFFADLQIRIENG